MGNIILLKEDTINKIAAGEIIERPASIVKELVENSIDAGASSITVEIKEGGKAYIYITDNGHGILEADLQNVFMRHATSKISSIEDLMKIDTLGFRGEAMSSISAVSEIELSTRYREETTGTYILVKNRSIIEKKSIGYPVGTSIKVKNLFYNTPARQKFLKSDRSESSYITDIMEKFALSNANISFKYTNNEKLIFHTPGNGDLISVIQCIFGLKAAKLMLPVSYKNELIGIEGYIAKPELTKGNSSSIIFSVNERVVKNFMLREAVRAAYKSLIMTKRYPFSILNITIDPEKVDVNVHPTKAEIKFLDERSIFNIIYYTINNVLSSNDLHYTNTIIKDDFTALKETDFIQTKLDSPFIRTDDTNIYSRTQDVAIIKDNIFSSKIESDNSDEEQSFVNKKLSRIIGQLFNTYILCQNDDKFFMIDQHAAHERIIFENLSKGGKGQIEQQPLLIPMIIELSISEVSNIKIGMEMLSELGFEVEIFGENSVAIRQVPLIMGHPCSGAVISELLDNIGDIKDNLSELKEKMLLQIACKSAIKAGDSLNNTEITSLVNELFNTRLYYTCPHGRPTILSFHKYELEKKFKRRL